VSGDGDLALSRSTSRDREDRDKADVATSFHSSRPLLAVSPNEKGLRCFSLRALLVTTDGLLTRSLLLVLLVLLVMLVMLELGLYVELMLLLLLLLLWLLLLFWL